MNTKEKHRISQEKYRQSNLDVVVDRVRKYRKSPRGKAGTMWTNMNQRCGSDKPKDRAYKNINICMTREEWMSWAVPEIEKFMRDNPSSTPSVDRKDSSKHYELSNLRIIDFLDNSESSTGRIGSAFSKMRDLYGNASDDVKEKVLEEFILKAKEALGMK